MRTILVVSIVFLLVFVFINTYLWFKDEYLKALKYFDLVSRLIEISLFLILSIVYLKSSFLFKRIKHLGMEGRQAKLQKIVLLSYLFFATYTLLFLSALWLFFVSSRYDWQDYTSQILVDISEIVVKVELFVILTR